MSNPYEVVRMFEQAVAEYTGAKYCVAVTSCTMALLLALRWHNPWERPYYTANPEPEVVIPKRTYVGVAMAALHAGFNITFKDIGWVGHYQLRPTKVVDAARVFCRDMYPSLSPDNTRRFVCLSFHWTKHLSIGQGGAILHEDDEADEWFRMMRFDGRKEGVAPKDQTDWVLGYHATMSPRDAAEGLSRLAALETGKYDTKVVPFDNDYPDLSQLEIFK